MLSEEEANFNFIVIGLIQPELKPTFYHTHDEQSSNPRSTTLKMSRAQTHDLPHSRWAELKPTIYHTQDEQSSNPRSTTLKMSTLTITSSMQSKFNKFCQAKSKVLKKLGTFTVCHRLKTMLQLYIIVNVQFSYCVWSIVLVFGLSPPHNLLHLRREC
jgi:hypothetical protein